MLRVLQVLNGMNRGGIETYIMNLYRTINRSKFQFDFLLNSENEFDYSPEIRSLGGNIYCVSPRRKGVLKNKRDLHRFFDNHPEFDAVHMHVSSLSNIAALNTARDHDVPIRIVHAHSTKQDGSRIHALLSAVNKMRIEHIATHHLACSSEVGRWAYGSTPFRLAKNGVDIGKFRYNTVVREDVRAEFRLGSALVIGHVGRFAHMKNHGFLLEILNDLVSLRQDVILLSVGEGELRKPTEKRAVEMGLQRHVRFSGIRSDIERLVQAMDVFVMPSIYEGFPVSVVEAQASGLPCVVSEAVTAEAKVLDSFNRLSLQSSIRSWSDAILKLGSKECERSSSFVTMAKMGYDIKDCADDISSLYENKS